MNQELPAGYLQPFDVVVFPIIEWFYRFQRPQQISTGLARYGHRVFYFRAGFSGDSVPQYRPIRKDLPIWEVQFGGSLQKNLYTDQLDAAAVDVLCGQMAHLRNAHRITKAVCLVDLPFWGPLALELKRRFSWKVAYDCLDHLSGFSLISGRMLEPEDDLAKKCDLLLATSHLLYEEKRRLNSNCLLLPNGTEFDHFNHPPVSVDPVLAGLRKPIIGYYGAIDDWFDADLVRRLATAHSDWSFVLIGDTARSDRSRLDGVENIYLLGEIPYESIPGYLWHFDVGIIPFKKIPLTDATNPVKLFEYLSAGKPIVAADLHELQYYREYVRLASTTEEWLSALDLAVKDYAPETVDARLRFARQNTWEDRISVLEDALQSGYQRQVDRASPMPLLFPRETLVSSRLLTRQNDTDYWCHIYHQDDLVYKQESRDLAEREGRFLAKLADGYFAKPLSVIKEEDYSVISFKRVDIQSLHAAAPALAVSADSLHRFFRHCLNILAAMSGKGITHRNICRENVVIRNGKPMLLNLEWAVSPGESYFTPDGLGGSERPRQGGFCDVYSMGKILGYVNRRRFSAFDRVISLMTAADPAMRITDIRILEYLLADAVKQARKEPV